MKTTHPHRPHRALLAATVLLLVLLAACSGQDDTSADSGAANDAEAPAEARDDTAAGAGDAGFELGAEEGGDSADSDGDVAQGQDGEEAPAPEDESDAPAQQPVDTTGTAATGERIIKEGTITLQVQPGEFDEAFRQVIVRAQELGGHVAGSSSSTQPAPAGNDEDDRPLVTGQVTVRVPVRNFEDLLTVVGEAGEIVDRNVTSQDVTAEFTDLESRRRHLQAQERFYLGLLEEAASVPDAIAVQQQLNGIQEQIEQITGRLTLLEDRTSFSTLTVQIRERGADPIDPLVAEEEGSRLTPYLSDAADTFVATVGSIIVVVTFLVPFLVLALIGYVVWRIARPKPQHQPAAPLPTPPATTAVPPPVTHEPREPAGVGGRGPEEPSNT